MRSPGTESLSRKRHPQAQLQRATPWSALSRVRERQESLCIGLMSGTSADAVDAALCRIEGTFDQVRLQVLAHHSLRLPRSLAARIHAARTTVDVGELSSALGEKFSQAAHNVASEAGVAMDRVDFIASHGQTLLHLPPHLSRHPHSLQVGEGAVIADRTGRPVVHDFRVRDLAAGGEGAPLVPYADWALFRKKGSFRALLNIGGIANVSAVGDSLSDTLAFDTGPGNMLLDSFARKASRGRRSFDAGGALASQGKVNVELLQELLRHPFFRRSPPKSAGREQFGEALAHPLWRRWGRRPADLMATAAALTVESIARALERFILPQRPLEAVYASGGGSRNPVLMKGLSDRLGILPVLPLAHLSFPEEAKEAAAFALLGHEWVMGTPQNVPSATGAQRRVLLGKLVL